MVALDVAIRALDGDLVARPSGNLQYGVGGLIVHYGGFVCRTIVCLDAVQEIADYFSPVKNANGHKSRGLASWGLGEIHISI